MTHITATKKLRMFDWDKNAKELAVATPGFRPEMTPGALVRRETILPAEERRNAGECPFCHMPVFVAKGQIINGYKQKDGTFVPSHKKCRN